MGDFFIIWLAVMVAVGFLWFTVAVVKGFVRSVFK